MRMLKFQIPIFFFNRAEDSIEWWHFMKISEAMVKKPITVTPDVLIYEAAKLMRDKKISSVIVVDKGIVKGILTERDLIRRVLAENKDPNQVKIDEVMT